MTSNNANSLKQYKSADTIHQSTGIKASLSLRHSTASLTLINPLNSLWPPALINPLNSLWLPPLINPLNSLWLPSTNPLTPSPLASVLNQLSSMYCYLNLLLLILNCCYCCIVITRSSLLYIYCTLPAIPICLKTV